MELQGVSSRPSPPASPARPAGLALLSALVALVVSVSLPVSARAASGSSVSAATTVADPNTPVLVSDETKPPAGYRLTALQARRIAASSPKIISELHRHPRARVYEYTKGPGRWQVSWFGAQVNGPELAQVYVDDASGRVTEAWTGFQVAWTMARGYQGAFGRRVNALYVWIPLCVLFVAPFIPWRRRPTLWHLDLLMLLGFSISMAFFNHGEIGLSVPLAYPFLVYLLVRMLFLGFGRGRPREPLRLIVPASWLAVAIVFLVGFRIGLNVTNSNVIDVGYAGVIGADKLLHGQHLYGHWPKDNAFGDTYGPVNYYVYVPFRAIFGWSGAWDDLPAAHAAAIAFDLLTLIGLYFLGRLIRGPTTGTILAYAWASYPFTIYALTSNSNDTLVAFLIVLALLVIRSAPARGVALGLAGMAKFVPFVLGPLFLRGAGDWPRRRSLVAYCAAVGATIVVMMLPVLLDGNLTVFWHDSLRSQIDRVSPFSIWGLWGGLKIEQHLVQGFCVGLAILVAFVPRRRGIIEVCALGAAVVIALELGLTHWFYLYIPWFFPLLIVALVGAHPAAALAEAPERAAGAETRHRLLPRHREPEPSPA